MRTGEQWMAQGSCVELPGLPWLEDHERVTPIQAETMRQVCYSCAVFYECQDFVACEEITGGFWAGQHREVCSTTGTVGGAA